MIKKKLGFNRRSSNNVETLSSREDDVQWEMRPGGMLVQKRAANSDTMVPNLRVRVSYGAVQYEIPISSQATFGELKKLLTAESGLQPAEQKLLFRGKERENREYLDRCGVKDRSKVKLIDDPNSKEKRVIEMRKNAKILAVREKISGVGAEIDMLEQQISVMEKSIANGKKVADVQITTLIEMLMRQAVKLDNISVEEVTCAAKRDLEGMRVQKCVETLDLLKVSNQRIKPLIVSTMWETFDHPLAQTIPKKWECFD